jgi:hypothetical protein
MISFKDHDVFTKGCRLFLESFKNIIKQSYFQKYKPHNLDIKNRDPNPDSPESLDLGPDSVNTPWIYVSVLYISTKNIGSAVMRNYINKFKLPRYKVAEFFLLIFRGFNGPLRLSQSERGSVRRP